jgi:signal transduction histidine kinase
MKKTLLIFGVCAAVLLAGVGWISLTAVRLDRAGERMRARAALEENVRLALWRMDSDVAPLIAREAARPTGEYTTGALGWPPPSRILLHFRFDADGVATTPEPASASGVAERLAALRTHVTRGSLVAALPIARAEEATKGAIDGTISIEGQSSKNSAEWQARARNVELNASYQQQRVFDANVASPDAAMTPLWIDGQLLLARRVVGDTLEGVWLDWPAIREWLAEDVRDLLPGAALEAASGAKDPQRMLASLPVTLSPGAFQAPASAGSGPPLALILGVTWGGVLLAAIAVLVLLVGALALGERRAAFVSAVTHELRTPLTTLRTYTEMLADGMITDEQKRTTYVSTLRREAVRLSNLVENVLVYARLERGRVAGRAEDRGVRDLWETVAPRPTERAAQAGLALEVDLPADLRVRADPSAVEQVLFNLVDNACKYAPSGGPITITAAPAAGGRVALRVRDHGPGVARAERRKLFRPFSRSAEQAAGKAPGVGLGLALSRRLARAMDGDLILEDGEGASFALVLPAAAAAVT